MHATERSKNQHIGRDRAHPFKIVQTSIRVVALYETSADSVRVPRRAPLPIDPQPSWLGYSIGRWKGNTLVAVTVGLVSTAICGWYRQGPPANRSSARNRALHMPRIRAPEIEITADGSKAYVKPWQAMGDGQTAFRYRSGRNPLNDNEKDQAHKN